MTRPAKPNADGKATIAERVNTDGTQAIRRAGAILRAIAKRGATGAGVSDIAREEQLPRSTVHRILKALVDEGFVEPAGADKRYQMGHLVHELALTPASSAVEVARWRPVVDAVARRTSVTSYLMRTSGVEAVCLYKADGHSIVRFVPVEVGQRRLLGVGAGATALLAAVAPTRLEQVLQAIEPGLARYPRLDVPALRTAIKLVQRTGFAISQGTVADDGFGMGKAVADPDGQAHLAISISAHASLVTESRIAAWKKVIDEEMNSGDF